jgi:hypothetical protein
VNVFGGRVPLHGYTLWHQRFVFLSSALFACGAALLGFFIGRRLQFGRWACAYAAVAVLLGTSLTYYATYMPSYGHAMDAFASAAFLSYWVASLGTVRPRRWISLGFLLGVAMLVRVQNIVLGVVVLMEVISHCRSRDPRWIVRGSLTLVIALLVFIPQLIEWHVVFGDVTHLPQGTKYTRFAAPMIAELLWSARNGWFSTTPIAYAGVIGLFFLPKRTRLVARALVSAVVVQIYLNSTILDWWGAASFGQRRLCSMTFPLVIGIAALLSRLGPLVARRRRCRVAAHVLTFVVIGSFVAWNLRRVRELRGGKAAPQELVTTCCARVPAPLRAPAHWIYERIGNPFEFPANAVFAIAHDVPLSRWDQIVGDYPIIPSFGDVRSNRSLVGLQGVWRVGSPNRQAWLLGGWSAPKREDRAFRFMTARQATVLVPNLMPEAQRITVWLRADSRVHVTLEWNGTVVAESNVAPTWTPATFELARAALHTNELTIIGPRGAGTRIAVADIEVRLR